MAVANQILAVLSAFSINPSQIGYFTLDNAESNTTAMVAIGTALRFNGRSRRGRFISYIINLAAKALLFGNNPDAFELDGKSPLNLTDYQLWLARGAISKLHNLVIDVSNMHKLHYGFQKAQQKAGIPHSLRLIINNDTR
jgi:hypothetical protein